MAMNENLKKQEQQFKAHCKVIPSHPHTVTPSHIHIILCNIQDEKLRLEEAISRLVAGDLGEVGGEESERVKAIRVHLEADKEKLSKIRALLVRHTLSLLHTNTHTHRMVCVHGVVSIAL